MIEVRFYENRGNGQSKGHCNIYVGTENSIRLIQERLPHKLIHDKKPCVAAPTKAALAQFESQSKTRPCQPSNSGAIGPGPRVPGPSMPGPGLGPYGMHHNMAMGPRMMGPIRGPRCPGPNGEVGSPPTNRMPLGPHPGHRPSFHSPQRPPMGFNPYNSRPPFRPHPHHQPMNMPCNVPQLNHGMDLSPRGYPTQQEWMRPQGHPYPYHPQGPPGAGPLPHPPPVGPPLLAGSPPSGHGPPSLSCPPAPHVNPAFFNSPYPEPMGDGFMSPTRAKEKTMASRPSPMKESEVEEIMSRNRTVSSSAISRAVADAATGDFASAIETLVTAISLIRQSKVSKEDRCRILVNSLQDTLHGIESKGYGRGRGRSRSRSRSRDRISRKMRHRSRSRERDYLRSRSRERLFDLRRSRSSSRDRESDRYCRNNEERSASRSSRHHDAEREHSTKSYESHRSRR